MPMFGAAQLLTTTVLIVTSLGQLPFTVSPGEDASTLRTVPWRLFDETVHSEVPRRLVADAQAMLIRAAILSYPANEADEESIAHIVTQARVDFERIAAAHPVDRSVSSEAMARADLSLVWMDDLNAKPSIKHRLALYAIAFAFIARDAEERALNPEGIVLRYLDNTVRFEGSDWNTLRRVVDHDQTPPFMEKADPANEPSRGTHEGRMLVKHDLLALATTAGVSAKDLDELAATFADQSLGGVKYIIELRNRLTKDDAP